MKKSLFLILALLTLASVSPAQVTVSESPLKKGFNMMSAEETLVLGECGSEVVAVVKPARGVITTYKDYEVQAFAKNGEIREVVLEDTKECELVAATLTDGKVYMIFASTTKNQFALNRVAVAVSDMRVATPFATIHSEMITKSDLTYWRSAKSTSGDFVGLVCGVYHNSTKEFQGREMLLDNTLGELWTKQYPLGAPDAMMVNDEGQMLTMSYYIESKTNRTNFRFGVLDEEGENVQEVTVNASTLAHIQLLNYIHGKFVLSGMEVDNPEQRSVNFSAICALVYDMNSHKMTQNTHPFTAEEVNVLENRGLKFGRKLKIVVNGLTPMSAAATDFGGAFSLARTYSVVTTGNTAANGTDYFTTGTLVAAVDTNGAFLWSKPFRNFLKEPEHTFFFHNNLCAQGSTVYLVQSEPAKSGLVYDISSTASKKAINGFKARTAVYAINPRGEVSKTMLGEASKQKVVTDLMPKGDGSYWFLTSMLNNSALHELKIQ